LPLLHRYRAGLEVLPVINKIDLPSADPGRVSQEIEEIIGIDRNGCRACQRQDGRGRTRSAGSAVKRIPPPKAILTRPCKR